MTRNGFFPQIKKAARRIFLYVWQLFRLTIFLTPNEFFSLKSVYIALDKRKNGLGIPATFLKLIDKQPS
jgi:hypothetical protein